MPAPATWCWRPRLSAAQLDGYIKPAALRRGRVQLAAGRGGWRQEPVPLGGEALVGGGETVLKNQRKDQFATRVSLSGNIHQRGTSARSRRSSILRNAFVEVAQRSFFERSPATRDDDG